jgi:excisionase family DNA binding protein
MADYHEGSDWLTVCEVADILRVHTNTVRRWSDKGLIKAYRVEPRGARRILLKDVLRVLGESETKHFGTSLWIIR